MNIFIILNAAEVSVFTVNSFHHLNMNILKFLNHLHLWLKDNREDNSKIRREHQHVLESLFILMTVTFELKVYLQFFCYVLESFRCHFCNLVELSYKYINVPEINSCKLLQNFCPLKFLSFRVDFSEMLTGQCKEAKPFHSLGVRTTSGCDI